MANSIKYKTSLYKENDTFNVHRFKTREQWLEMRVKGIGSSDSSAVISQNPYKTNEQLYREKVGLVEPRDISNEKAVRYGTLAEEYIRRLLQLEYEDKYEVHYLPNTILQSKKHTEQLFSADGLLVEKATGRKGILEIKTTTILASMQRESWKEAIPQNYFIQVLHGLNVTGYDFVLLRVQMLFGNGYSQLKDYVIERNDSLDDLEYLSTEITKFWEEHIITMTPPPLRINI